MSSSAESSTSENSQPPLDVTYPLNIETEVPHTNGGLFKTVLVEGTGSKPVKGAKVTVHYVGTLEDGTKFDSSRDRGEYFEFTLGKGQVIKGWDSGVMTMRMGEKALLKCSPDYAYGPTGSPPKIPPNATLLFEVELFNWTREIDISAKKDLSLMKDVLADGVDYENPDFESHVIADVSIYLGLYSQDKAGSMTPVWSKKGWDMDIGEMSLPPFLEECLKTMRKKELAVCRVRSFLISESFPDFGIPSAAERQNADVSYLIEIHELKNTKSWEFSGADKITQGDMRINKGNAALKAGNSALAERFYRRALEFIGEDHGFDDSDKTACHKSRIRVMGNLAQVLLERKEYNEVVSYGEKILKLDSNNKKALFRMAKALDGRQDWDEALACVRKILQDEPNNTEAKVLQAHIIQEKKTFDQKQKSLFKKMFA